MLHSGYPVRYGDADLGIGEKCLLVRELTDATDATDAAWRELTPASGRGLHEAQFDVAPYGCTVVTTWSLAQLHGSRRTAMVALAVADGARTVLHDDGSSEVGEPMISPDGTTVAFLVERLVVALEPAPDVRTGLCRVAARSRAVHRLRPGVHPSQVGPVGR